MSTMPGLPTRPCFYDIDLDPVTEEITGLFWACSPTLFSWVSSHLYHINYSEEAAIVSLYIFHKQLLTVRFVPSNGCRDFAASPGSEALQTSLFLFLCSQAPCSVFRIMGSAHSPPGSSNPSATGRKQFLSLLSWSALKQHGRRGRISGPLD